MTLVLAVSAAAGCELVLGDLPPVKKHDAGTSSSSSSGSGGNGGNGAGGAGTGGATSTTGTGGATASSGTGGSTTSGTGGDCDADGDLHPAIGICGGDDCDDGDIKAYPGETVYYGTASPTVGFDYDCNGVTERDPALVKTVECGLIGLPCAASIGYLAPVAPPCGGTGSWGTCKQQGLGCAADVIESAKLMKCK